MPLLAECITILVLHPEDPNMLKDLNDFIQKKKPIRLYKLVTQLSSG